MVTGSPTEVKIDVIDVADDVETFEAEEVGKMVPEPVALLMVVNTE